MPYKDPARKTAWDSAHRPEKLTLIKKAAAWADGQIATLRSIGQEPNPTTRRELVSAYLAMHQVSTTEETLGNPPDPIP